MVGPAEQAAKQQCTEEFIANCYSTPSSQATEPSAKLATCRKTTVAAYAHCKTYPYLTNSHSSLVTSIEARHATQFEHSIVALEPELDLPMAVAAIVTTNTESFKISAN